MESVNGKRLAPRSLEIASQGRGTRKWEQVLVTLTTAMRKTPDQNQVKKEGSLCPLFIMGVQSNMLGKTWWQQYEVVEHRKQGEGLGGRKGGRRKREGREGESEGERERD